MTQADIKQNLISQLERINSELVLQRISDFMQGVIAAAEEQNADWWDELSAQDHADLKESLEDAKAGREKPMEEVFKKYGL